MSVSVVIPFYNSENFIDETISSILNQSHQDLEVICINDGSQDKTSEILHKWQSLDSRIIIIEKENGGIETGLKSALPHLKKKYTFLIGHDDQLSQDALYKAMEEISRENDFDAVRMKLVLTFENKASEDFKDKFEIFTGEEAVANTIIYWKTHTFCLWKTDIFKQIQHVTTGKLMNFDEVATRFLYTKCRKVSFCDGIYYYLQHPSSITHKFSSKLLDTYAVDFYIKKILVESNFYLPFKKEFENSMFSRLDEMTNLYFRLKKEKHKLTQNDIEKIRLLYKAIDFKYLKKKNSFIENIKYNLLFNNFNIYFLYKKIKHAKSSNNQL